MDKAGIKQRIREKRMQKMQDRAFSSAKILGSLPKSIDPLTLAAFRIDEIHEMEHDLKELDLIRKVVSFRLSQSTCEGGLQVTILKDS